MAAWAFPMCVVLMLTLAHLAGENGPAAYAAQLKPSAPLRSGAQILRSSCETCHSLHSGEIKVAPSLYGALNGPRPRHTRAEVAAIVQVGVRKMPAFGNVLTHDELERICDALEALRP